jgi:hypothetical protein
MDDIKIRNFEATHPGKPLPKLRHLNPAECELLRTTMASNLGLSGGSNALEVLLALEHRAGDVPDVRPSEETFNLAKLCSQLQLDASTIYINWSSFDDIDEMPLQAFSNNFHDLWYPSSDDIEIFDRGQKWVLLVRHFDVAQIVRL